MLYYGIGKYISLNSRKGFWGKGAIECSSDLTEPYAMKPEVYLVLIDLCADICKRNGKRKLVWIADRDQALAYAVKSDEMLLTVHRWFAKKSCPGNWLMERLGSLADEVNGKLGV